MQGRTLKSVPSFGEQQEQEQNTGGAPTMADEVMQAKEPEVQEAKAPDYNMQITTPAHLWRLGAAQFKFSVASTTEAYTRIKQMQTLFAKIESELQGRMEQVEAIENRVSLAQREVLEDMAAEGKVELPDDLSSLTKTRAGHLISENSKPALKAEAPKGNGGYQRSGGWQQNRQWKGKGSNNGGGWQSTGQQSGDGENRQLNYALNLAEKAGVDPNTLDLSTPKARSAAIDMLKDRLGYQF